MICVGTLITPWGLSMVETRVMRVRELEGELRIGYRCYRNLQGGLVSLGEILSRHIALVELYHIGVDD
jgi:hypothetical protein